MVPRVWLRSYFWLEPDVNFATSGNVVDLNLELSSAFPCCVWLNDEPLPDLCVFNHTGGNRTITLSLAPSQKYKLTLIARAFSDTTLTWSPGALLDCEHTCSPTASTPATSPFGLDHIYEDGMHYTGVDWNRQKGRLFHEKIISHPFHRICVHSPGGSSSSKNLINIMKLINQVPEGGAITLSPSVLDYYIDTPFRFFFSGDSKFLEISSSITGDKVLISFNNTVVDSDPLLMIIAGNTNLEEPFYNVILRDLQVQALRSSSTAVIPSTSVSWMVTKAARVLLQNISLQGFYGTALHLRASSFCRIQSSTFINNTSPELPGAVLRLVEGSEATLEHCLVSHNSVVSGNGGAIYSSEASSLLLSDSQLIRNHALLGFGGAIYSFESKIRAERSVFRDNYASSAGALFLGNAILEPNILSNCTLSNNSAHEDGGALYVSLSIAILNEFSEFHSNSAGSRGGAIFATKGSIINFTEISIEACESNGSGGALFFHTGSSLSFFASTAFENHAADEGGFLYADGTETIGIYNATLSKNEASVGAVGYIANSDRLILSAGTNIKNNTAIFIPGDTASGRGGAFAFGDGLEFMDIDIINPVTTAAYSSIPCSSTDLCLLCQGDCNTDQDCLDGLKCFQRDSYTAVSACPGMDEVSSNVDVCVPDDVCVHFIENSAQGGGGHVYWSGAVMLSTDFTAFMSLINECSTYPSRDLSPSQYGPLWGTAATSLQVQEGFAVQPVTSGEPLEGQLSVSILDYYQQLITVDNQSVVSLVDITDPDTPQTVRSITTALGEANFNQLAVLYGINTTKVFRFEAVGLLPTTSFNITFPACEEGYYVDKTVEQINGVCSPCGGADVFCPYGATSPLPASDGQMTLPAGADSLQVRSSQAPCPAGNYCTKGVNYTCPGGSWSRSGSASPLCLPCAAGRYGLGGSPREGCDGECEAGFYCPERSSSSRAIPCGGEYVFCEKATVEPSRVPTGFYSVPLESPADSRSGITECEAGYFCTGGTRSLCPAGSYSTTGAAQCSLCDGGRWSDGNGTVTTSECMGPCSPGYYCPKGSEGAETNPCGDSSVYCAEGSVQPRVVPRGYYSSGSMDNTTRSGIMACEKNFFCLEGVRYPCPRGEFTSSEGQSECQTPLGGDYVTDDGTIQKCELGHSCSAGLMTPCASGEYADQMGLSFCKTADRGYAAPTTLEQTVCPPGTFSNAPGNTACTNCPEGGVSVEGSSFCVLCRLSGLQVDVESQTCISCPNNAASLDGLTCLCEIQYLLDVSLNQCIECPASVDCSEFGTSSDNLILNPGYYLVPSTSAEEGGAEVQGFLDPVACLNEANCVGGSVSTGGENSSVCSEFRTGPLCAQCIEGRFEWGGNCITCDPEVYAPAFVVLVILTWIYVRIIHTLSNPPKPTGSAGAKCLMFFISTFRIIVGNEIRWLSWFSFLDFEADQGAGGLVCLLPLDPYDKMTFQVGVPFLGLFLLGITALYKFCKISIFNACWPQNTPILFNGNRYLRTLTSLSLFSYSAISNTTFAYLDCMDIGGLSLVRTNPGIDCASEKYRDFLPVVGVCLAYVVLFPAFPWIYLRQHYKAGTLKDVQARVGVFFETYDYDEYYFESLALFRRTIFVVIATSPYFYLNSIVKSQLFVFFSIIFFLFHQYRLPYFLAHDDLFESISLCALAFISLFLTGLSDYERLPPVTQAFVSIVMLLVLLAFLFLQLYVNPLFKLGKCLPQSLVDYLGEHKVWPASKNPETEEVSIAEKVRRENKKVTAWRNSVGLSGPLPTTRVGRRGGAQEQKNEGGIQLSTFTTPPELKRALEVDDNGSSIRVHKSPDSQQQSDTLSSRQENNREMMMPITKNKNNNNNNNNNTGIDEEPADLYEI